MKISNVDTHGIISSVVASGYPKRIDFNINDIHDESEDIFKELFCLDRESTALAEKHVNRATKLGNCSIGSGHDIFLRGIVVQFDVCAPQYWWQQFQRYGHIDFVS